MSGLSNGIKQDPVYASLIAFTPEQVALLSKKLDARSKEYAKRLKSENQRLYIAYTSEQEVHPEKKKRPYFYHTYKHALEMYWDAKLIEKRVSRFMPNVTEEDKARIQLYVKLVQAMHAVHDLIQNQGPQKNEIDSYKEFADDFTTMLTELGISPTQNQAQIDMAKTVIVDGTVFNFNEKSSTGDLAFTQQVASKTETQSQTSSILTDLAMLSISMNDTARMVMLSEMLEDPDARNALQKQFDSLKNNLLVKQLLKNMSITLPITNQMMHTFDKKEFDGLDNKQNNKDLLQVLSFMQDMGQNFRMILEWKPEQDNNGNRISTPYIDAIVLGMQTQNLNHQDDDVANAYEYIMKKMEQEVGANGFSTGMGEKTANVEAINKKFQFKHGIDKIFDERNKDAWKVYVVNAKKVLKGIREQEKSIRLVKGDLLTWQENIIKSFADMAHNQTATFMPKVGVVMPKPKVGVAEKIAKIEARDNNFMPKPTNHGSR